MSSAGLGSSPARISVTAQTIATARRDADRALAEDPNRPPAQRLGALGAQRERHDERDEGADPELGVVDHREAAQPEHAPHRDPAASEEEGAGVGEDERAEDAVREEREVVAVELPDGALVVPGNERQRHEGDVQAEGRPRAARDEVEDAEDGQQRDPRENRHQHRERGQRGIQRGEHRRDQQREEAGVLADVVDERRAAVDDRQIVLGVGRDLAGSEVAAVADDRVGGDGREKPDGRRRQRQDARRASAPTAPTRRLARASRPGLASAGARRSARRRSGHRRRPPAPRRSRGSK